MTEHEWLTSRHGQEMIAFVQKATTSVRTRWLGWMQARRFPVTDRQIRLIEVACCDRAAALVPMPQLRSLVGLARRQAEGKADSVDQLQALEQAALRVSEQLVHAEGTFLGWSSAQLLAVAAIGRLFSRTTDPGDVLGLSARARAEAQSDGDLSPQRWPQQTLRAEQAYQAAVVRDIIGNPFRPEPVDPAWLSAHDGAIRRIAEEVAENDAFEQMPILADALEDAGCTSEALLQHCRGPGPHFAGCWAVHLLLARP